MQDNNINTIIANSLRVDKEILYKNIKPIIVQLKKTLDSNKDAIKCNRIITNKNINNYKKI